MSEPVDHNDKHTNIRDLHHVIASYVDGKNPEINAAKAHFESAYQEYQSTPEDYIRCELTIASAKKLVNTVFHEHDIETTWDMPHDELHRLADRLNPDQAKWIHQALHDIDEYTFWHKDHEFDDHRRIDPE